MTDKGKRKVAESLPELRIGDVWVGTFFPETDEATIVDLEPIPGYPWPLVYVDMPDKPRGSSGAPAFLMGTLVKRGSGRAWKP